MQRPKESLYALSGGVTQWASRQPHDLKTRVRIPHRVYVFCEIIAIAMLLLLLDKSKHWDRFYDF
jgi:hypothetical protein